MTEWDIIDSINALPEPERSVRINDFLTERIGIFENVAVKLVRRYSMDPHMVPDITQEVMMVAYNIFNDPKERKKAEKTKGWIYAIYLFSQNVAKRLSESGEVTGSSGMSTTVRRRRALMKFRNEQSALLGRELKPAELIEAFNKKMLESRSDPKRQGMLATEADLQPFRPAELDPSLNTAAAGHESDCPLIPAEARKLIRLMLSECAERDRELGVVAKAFYGEALGEPPHIATPAEVVAETGLPIKQVRSLMRTVEDVAVEILGQMGVQSA